MAFEIMTKIRLVHQTKGIIMSYKERSIWVSLFVTLYIWVNYFSQVYSAAADLTLTVDLIKDLLIEVVIMTVILEIALKIFIAIIDDKDADYSEDERDKLIMLLGAKQAYNILSFTIIVAVVHLLFPGPTQFVTYNLNLPQEYAVINLIILGGLIAEVAKFATQVFYYRRGF